MVHPSRSSAAEEDEVSSLAVCVCFFFEKDFSFFHFFMFVQFVHFFHFFIFFNNLCISCDDERLTG